ncbi:MAG: hypothetical protein R3F02_09395 [Thiolinea sp.]
MLKAIVNLSRDEYLELDKASDIRHEHLDGQVFAMVGGSIQYARAAGAGNVFSALDRCCVKKNLSANELADV